MELHSWSGDFGLPTWHQKCLAMQTYAKFTGAPVTIVPSDNPFWTPDGDLPVFLHQGQTITEFSAMVSYLETVCRFSTDVALSPRQRAEATAFKKMLEQQLEPALALHFWLDARNCIDLTRPWYAKRLGFPLAFVYPRRYLEHATALVGQAHSGASAFDNDMDFAVTERAIVRTAEDCLRCLSQRLGDQQFMFGKSPSSLDAVVFSFLAPLLKVPVTSTAVQDLVKSFPSLTSYVSHILSAYFPRLNNDNNAKEENNGNQKKDKSDPEDNSGGLAVSWTNNVAAATVAIVCMGGYAYVTGLAGAISFGRLLRNT